MNRQIITDAWLNADVTKEQQLTFPELPMLAIDWSKNMLSIKVHAVGLGKIYKTYEIKVTPETSLEELYGLIEAQVNDQYVPKRLIAATLQPLDLSKIGRWWFRDGSITSDYPDAKPNFVLDKSDPTKLISDCGISDGAELVFNNGMKD